MSIESVNHQQPDYDGCDPKARFPDPNLDPPANFCGDNDPTNTRVVNDDSLNWLKDQTMKKTGFGARQDCDPMQRG